MKHNVSELLSLEKREKELKYNHLINMLIRM
jgi:hypothetical protein